MKEREELEKEVEMDVKDEKEQVSNQAKPNALALIPSHRFCCRVPAAALFWI